MKMEKLYVKEQLPKQYPNIAINQKKIQTFHKKAWIVVENLSV